MAERRTKVISTGESVVSKSWLATLGIAGVLGFAGVCFSHGHGGGHRGTAPHGSAPVGHGAHGTHRPSPPSSRVSAGYAARTQGGNQHNFGYGAGSGAGYRRADRGRDALGNRGAKVSGSSRDRFSHVDYRRDGWRSGWRGSWRHGHYRGYRKGYYRGWYHRWVRGAWGWPGRYPFGWVGGVAVESQPSFVYCNPYFIAPVEPVSPGEDYSQPPAPPVDDELPAAPAREDAPVPEDEAADTEELPLPPNAPREALASFAAAREAFKQGRYAEALEHDAKAIRLMPGDPTLHEFRGLTLFALKKFGAAAAVIHAVVATGPGWDWPTVKSLYADSATYTEQFRALEAFQRANPDDAAVAFLLAYHDLVVGQPGAAIKQLEKVVRLQPKDTLSARLLAALKEQGPDPREP
jgi:hypothetical protein